MFALAVNDILELKTLNPAVLFDGMPISVKINNSKELYIWWEAVDSIEDNHLVIRLNSPNNNLGAFKKVFNRFILSPSIPFLNPTAEEIGIYWVDTSMLSLYLACTFIVGGIRQYRWVQLTNNVGGK